MTESGEGGGMSSEDALKRAELLMTRLEEARARLEATNDPEVAIDVLQELADLAREVEQELQRARDEARDENS
jgi:exonuclease VII small subunit